MTTRDDDQPGDDTSAPPPATRRPGRRRTQVVAGVAGLAAALGGGAYVTTSAIMADKSTGTSEITAQDVRVAEPLASESADSSGVGSAPGEPGSPLSAVPTVDASGSPLPSKVVEEIREARRRMAEDGVGVKHPVPQKVTTAGADVKRTTKGSLKDGGILRLVTARTDLTGKQELASVAGGVRKHRNVPCSQTFKFATSPEPKKKANLLMCWRTTPQKSVVAIVVDPKGKPSRDKAVDALKKKWRAMD